MDGFQLSQGYRAITRTPFTFYHSVPWSFWYTVDRRWKDERLSWPWSYPVTLNPGPLDWESSTLTTRPLVLNQEILREIEWLKQYSNKSENYLQGTLYKPFLWRKRVRSAGFSVTHENYERFHKATSSKDLSYYLILKKRNGVIKEKL